MWSVTEGWEPLCEFLEVPVPDMPFPRVNDSREFVDRVVDGALYNAHRVAPGQRRRAFTGRRAVTAHTP